MLKVIPVEPWDGRDATVSSGYGPRNGRLHRGADFMIRYVDGDQLPSGHKPYKRRWIYPTWARAAADGKVRSIARISNGVWLWIEHEDGLRTQYGHLGELAVRVGEIVSCGQRLAGPCERKLMYPPHLHFGLSPINHLIYRDPVPWLSA